MRIADLCHNKDLNKIIYQNINKIKSCKNISSNNFVELEINNKIIHIKADTDKGYQITGEEIQRNKSDIKTTKLKMSDNSVKYEEYSKKWTEEFQGYLETVKDKDGKTISRTLTKPEKGNPGVLIVLKEVMDKNGNLIEVTQPVSVKKFGDEKNRIRIERNYKSPSGTESRQLILEIPNGFRTEYKIGDKTFNRVSKNIKNNTKETYAWGKKFITKYNKKNIEVTAIKKDGKSETVLLNNKQLDFSMMPIYKKLPGDYLYTIAKQKTKTKITDSEIWKNNAYFCSNNNEIVISLERAEDPFTFAHEYGHMIDELPLKNLNKDKKLKEIFSKELDAYKNQASNLNEQQIMYFIAKDHKGKNGCLAETIAESVAILSGLRHNENHLLLRAKILQENFPETIAYVGSKMQEVMDKIL